MSANTNTCQNDWADLDYVKALESAADIDTLDDLFHLYLPMVLSVATVWKAEVWLFNVQSSLIPIAQAQWEGTATDRRLKLRSESWALGYPTKSALRRFRTSFLRPRFAYSLMDAGTFFGVLVVYFDRIQILNEHHINTIYRIGLLMASKIKEIHLKARVSFLSTDLKHSMENNRELRQQATSLSKELYAITAISTKIYQSMDFDTSLTRAMATIRKIFKVKKILLFSNSQGNRKMVLRAEDSDDDQSRGTKEKEFLKSLQSHFLNEVLEAGKPLCSDATIGFIRHQEKHITNNGYRHVIGVPFNYKETITGVLVLLHTDTVPISHSGLRMLSGIANITGMAIENKKLYRQSLQKKSEMSFLFQSITKFNETLDLEKILSSVAQRGVKFGGVGSQVYLFSFIKRFFFHSHFLSEKTPKDIHSVAYTDFPNKDFKTLYKIVSAITTDKAVLVKNTLTTTRIADADRQLFKKLNIHSLIAVFLTIKKKRLGLLLLAKGRQCEPFESNDHAFVKALASAASLAIENARAYQASQEVSDFLEQRILDKSAQIETIQSREQVRIENRTDIIFRVNRRNRFVFVNKAMELYSNLSRETLCHKDFKALEVVAPKDRARIRSCFTQILHNMTPMIKGIEYQHLNHRGNNRTISLTIYPEIDTFGQVLGVEGIGRDITEEKRLEVELKKAKDLALLGEFSSAVAHQMRNPLGDILMGVKRLQGALSGNNGKEAKIKSHTGSNFIDGIPHAAEDIFANLVASVHNLNQVVTELLDYTKTLRLTPSKQLIKTLVKETIDSFSNSIEQQKIEVIEKSIDRSMPGIFIDAVLISQVFQNVIHNAIQAMPKGGRLTIEFSIPKNDPTYQQVSIRDTGPGIAPQAIEKVFHPFYTTKSFGTGLGLSLAHRIIEAHGGRIWVLSNPAANQPLNGKKYAAGLGEKPNTGTAVSILLPISENDADLEVV
jgi:PAS domain S-box-containing protein